MPEKFLQGRAAIVTGGASGLGKAIALRLAAAGANVCIMSLSTQRVERVDSEVKYFAEVDEIERARGEIEDLGVQALAFDGDISSRVDAQLLVGEAVSTFGRLDILVNNAATNVVHPVLNHDDDAWFRVIDVNLCGPYLCTRNALPHLIKNGWGRIISIASTNAHVGTPDYSAYAASKHGLLGFNKSLALEVGWHNITANTISPAAIDTPSAKLHAEKWAEQQGMTYEETIKEFMKHYPQGRFIQPEEIADLVAYLCREEARAINGEDIKITTGASY